VNIDPTISTVVPSYTICSGNSVTLNYTVSGGTPGYTYSWNTGPVTSSISVNPTATTNYTVTITDAIGCSKAFTIPVTVFAKPTIGISGNTILCIGDATTLNANGGVSYSWNTGSSMTSIVVSPTATTNYSVTATSTAGCTSTATVATTVLPPPVAGITGNDTICIGNSALLNGSGAGSYLWNTGQTATNYSLVVTVGSCTDTANYSVAVIPNPTANAGSNISITAGQSTTLSASGGGTYQWNNGMTGQVISVSPTATTQYCVVVNDASGCKDTSCVTVFIEPIDCSVAGELYLPNAFSPNGDYENDMLQIHYGNMSCIKSLKITIYDRWGEEVFESEISSFSWDGTYKGKKLTTAVFTYFLEVVYVNTPADGAPDIRKGNISLLR
jgi:gliding motility-associated-like protein